MLSSRAHAAPFGYIVNNNDNDNKHENDTTTTNNNSNKTKQYTRSPDKQNNIPDKTFIECRRKQYSTQVPLLCPAISLLNASLLCPVMFHAPEGGRLSWKNTLENSRLFGPSPWKVLRHYL